MSELLRIEGISRRKSVKTDDGVRNIQVLHEFSLSVNSGEIIAVLGPSGSGKSTLLRMLNGLESPDSGAIFLEGVDISKMDPPVLRRKIGMVFQSPAFVADTVRENLRYGPRLAGKPLENSDGALARLLEMVQLDGSFLPRNPDALSQGEKQRVSIAMALSNQPTILLMDEPTSALDAATAMGIIDLLLELNRKLGLTLVVVTHVVEHAEHLQCGRKIVMQSRTG
jgi:ABC-type methionine transport system ATPase subunit